ncbi:hypothetical protein GGR53DRAFT_465431 [Hypoxylon sp. FL1150]|nr:hypothetical protein GGR53DRAFT_465431 [Hypoxylon sp. FL1150]
MSAATTAAANGSGLPSVVSITHPLSWERIFRYEGKRTKGGLTPGEKFTVTLTKNLLWTLWWCWGDVKTGLKDKRLHMWHESKWPGKPTDDFVREWNWILGEDHLLLDWRDVTEGGKITYDVVE